VSKKHNKQAGAKSRPIKKNELSDGHEKFIKVLQGPSEGSSIILRCHLLVEYFMDKIIQISLKRGHIITDNDVKFSFYHKLFIIKSLDVIKDDVLISIKKLNKVRNKLSHEMDYIVLESDIDSIGQPFGDYYAESKKKARDDDELLVNTLMKIVVALELSHDDLLEKIERGG